jgi:phosphoenolpyruvate carboxykinase (ATP)
MKLAYTRAMVRAALAGELDHVPTMRHEVFGLDVPKSVPGVASDVMDPRATWRDPAAYDAQARKLAQMFAKNFEQFAEHVGAAVRKAGPNT